METRVEKEWKTKVGYPAIILKSGFVSKAAYELQTEWRCGYVGIPAEHPLFGVKYDDTVPFLEMDREEPIGSRGIVPLFLYAAQNDDERSKGTRPDVYFDVHGGITYSGIRKEGPPGLWWFGFDTNHFNDKDVPLEYVEEECEKLARQLFQVEKARRKD